MPPAAATASPAVAGPAAVDPVAGLEHRLRAAVAAEELQLVFQPVVDLPVGSVRGFEALVRWYDPVLGQVSPEVFIPVAERSGLIADLGAWVLRTACAAASTWLGRSGARAPSISVNVSARQLSLDTFVPLVKQALKDFDLGPDRLCLEITETAGIEDLAETARRLGELTKLGVRLALDDFGTGYASLTMLRSLPFDVVKIDRSFVSDVATTATDAVLVRLIVDAAHALGQKVCAEGIETPEQARQVIAIGVDMAQGWLYGRPSPDSAELRARMAAPVGTQVDAVAVPPSLLLGASDDLVLITSPTGVITYASNNCVSILGSPSSDLIGTRLSEHLHPDPVEMSAGADAPATPRDGEVTHRVRHRDGSYRWFTTRTQVLREDDSSVRELLSISRDVTETVLARRALRDSEQQFKHAFDDALLGMALSTPDGRLVRVNRAFADLLGYSPEELTRRTVADITPETYWNSDSDNTFRLLDGTDAQVDVTKTYLHASGRHIAVQVRAALVRAGGGHTHVLAHVMPSRNTRTPARPHERHRVRPEPRPTADPRVS